MTIVIILLAITVVGQSTALILLTRQVGKLQDAVACEELHALALDRKVSSLAEHRRHRASS